MDKPTRSAIEHATQAARVFLQDDYREQLEGTFDVLLDGKIAAKSGAHLSARQRILREKIVAAVEHKRAAGMKPSEAVADYLRDAAFTTLNRFVALKMLEARGLVQECVSKGEQSSGYKEFCGLAPGVALLPEGAGYRLYVECLYDELSTEVRVLFDRRDAASVLWPKRATFDALLNEFNAPGLATVWGEDETIGWVYQYFNSGEERRKMRDESQAPRDSRELAVRNQFFTPRYVVQFLTDNTLGRIWYEMRQGDTALRDRCEYMVRRSNELMLATSAAEGDEPAWLEKVRAGVVDAVPENFSWRDSAAFAHLINGYALAPALGFGDLAGFANPKCADAERSGRWDGTATELWICLFFEHRRVRHGGIDPEGAQLKLLDELCRALRAKLVAKPPREEATDPVSIVRFRAKKDPRDVRVLDPACGSGHFLLYAFELLLVMYEEAWDDPKSPESEATGRTLRVDYPERDALRRDVPALVLRHNLHGVDIDPRCAQIAQLALWLRAQRAWLDAGTARDARPRVTRTNVVIAEPMPGDTAMVGEFAGELRPPLLGDLFRTIVESMRLAGEMGALLRADELLKSAIERGRQQFHAERGKKSGFLPGMEPARKQVELDLSGITDEAFFHDAEERMRVALRSFVARAGTAQAVRRRLFAEDAGQGLAFVELCEQRYDVVLMNPPFGEGSRPAKLAFERAYPRTKNDVYAAFVERGIEMLRTRGRLGAITSRTGFFLSSFQRWREEILLAKAPPVVFADLGNGVLDSAMVETAAYCLEVAA